MTTTLTAHLGDLAEALRDLRRRLREAARVEVARAIGEALREFALATIGGPPHYHSTPRSSYSAWEDPWRDPGDPWRDPGDEPWRSHDADAREVETDDADRDGSMTLPPALIAGFAAARWGFVRTRQIGPAILIGVLVALGTYAGGPTVKALLEAWSAANDLLTYPRHDRSF